MFISGLRHDNNLTACNCRECVEIEENGTATGMFDEMEFKEYVEPKQKFTASGKKKKRGNQ